MVCVASISLNRSYPSVHCLSVFINSLYMYRIFVIPQVVHYYRVVVRAGATATGALTLDLSPMPVGREFDFSPWQLAMLFSPHWELVHIFCPPLPLSTSFMQRKIIIIFVSSRNK